MTHEDEERQSFTVSHLSTYSDLTDSPTVTYKEALGILEHECESFKNYSELTSIGSVISTGFLNGYFWISGIKIALPKLLSTAAKFFVFTGGACLATAISAGAAVLFSFIIDIGKCFINYYKRRYSPNKKKNTKLFLKELKAVIVSSFIGAALSFTIGFIICMFLFVL